MLQRKIIKQQGSWAQNSIICPGLLKTGITAVLKSQTSGNIFNIKYRIVELSSSSPGHAFSTRAAWAKFFFFFGVSFLYVTFGFDANIFCKYWTYFVLIRTAEQKYCLDCSNINTFFLVVSDWSFIKKKSYKHLLSSDFLGIKFLSRIF